MTAYSVVTSGSTTASGNQYLALQPVSRQARIVRIELWGSVNAAGAIMQFGLINYSGGTISGATRTPLPLRVGAAAATASAKSGTTPPTGTPTTLTNLTVPTGSSTSYSFPFDYILSSASALAVFATTAGSGTYTYSWVMDIYFEELGLARST